MYNHFLIYILESLDIAFEKAKKVKDTSDTDIELEKSKRKSRVHQKVYESSSSKSDTIDATNFEMSFLKNDQNIEASKYVNKGRTAVTFNFFK